MGTITGGGSLGLDVFLLLGPALVADSAASGLELLEEPAELNDACAVFADSEAVGGPEEKIDLEGVLKSVDDWVVSLVVDGTGRELVEPAICC
jgi:activator of 2-hydroxyglutaryl-CoA dehydratase